MYSGSSGAVPALQWSLGLNINTTCHTISFHHSVGSAVVCLWQDGRLFVCAGSVVTALLRWDTLPTSCCHATWPGQRLLGCCSLGQSPSACHWERTLPTGCCLSSQAQPAAPGSARTEHQIIVINRNKFEVHLKSPNSLHNLCDCLSACLEPAATSHYCPSHCCPGVVIIRRHLHHTKSVSLQCATQLQTWRPSCLARRGSPPSNTICSNVVWSPNNNA